jgi:hypothetical protein
MSERCTDCGVVLSIDERTYYETHCEVCEGEASARMDAALTDNQALLGRIRLAQLADRAIEALAAIAGLVGAWLLAAKGEHAAWGWLAFLASNIGWIAFGWIRRHWFLLAQQVGFTASSVLGIWRWLL